MILSEIWAEAGRLLSDPSNQRWTTDILTVRANLAQIEIQGYTNAVKTQEILTPIAGQSYLSLNANTMDIIRATKTRSTAEIIPFVGMTREELDFQYPNWPQWLSGEPLYWFYDATLQRMNLVPTPDNANAIANGITVWESRKPAPLVLSTDTPFDGNNQMIPYHMAIVHWTVAQCWMDDATPESLSKARFHKSGSMLSPGEYEKQIGRILAEFDITEAVPERILWRPEGGRTGSWWTPSKSNPLPFN